MTSKSKTPSPMHNALARRRMFRALLWFMLISAGLAPGSPPELIQLQSAHRGAIKKLVLVYTWSAEMSVVSLADILQALPDTRAWVISQFDPQSEAFRAFATSLTRGGLGHDRRGKPRLQFVQDPRPYGPWPRDQALIDTSGTMWVGSSDQHRLREILDALDASYGINRRAADFAFTGANLLQIGDRLFYPDRLDPALLSRNLRGPLVALPSPPQPAPFHLDLLMMPLSDKVVVVGDVALARAALSALSEEEQQRVAAQWLAEFAAAAHNLEPARSAGGVKFRQNRKPALILNHLLQEKFETVSALLRPGVFRRAVQAEPAYPWDDRIAAALQQMGYQVVRLPFWPGAAGTVQGKKASGLPMMCYPNLLVWDEGLLMPVYGIPSLDDLARSRLELATGRKVHTVRGGALLGYGNSGPHCLTLEFRD